MRRIHAYYKSKKDLVVIDQNLDDIKKGTKNLLKEADACFTEIDKQIWHINQMVSSLPSDAKDSELSATLSSLAFNRLASEEFSNSAKKIQDSLDN